MNIFHLQTNVHISLQSREDLSLTKQLLEIGSGKAL